MSEAALADRLRTSSPTLFSAQELATICAEFRVRPDYLLFGEEPMLRDDLVPSRALEQFAPALRQHLARVLEIRLEQDAEWINSYLGPPTALLEAIEAGLADAIDDSVQQSLADRKLVMSKVREVVAASARAATPFRTVSDDIFKVATAGLNDGTLIDLGDVDTAAQNADPLIVRAEELKPFAEVSDPDSRRLGWSILNQTTGEIRPMHFADHYGAIKDITLNEEVPTSIQTLFNTARNVLVYSWQVYNFTVVAELQAYLTLEFALRERMGIGGDSFGPGFAKLLKRAIKEGLLADEAFASLRPQRRRPINTGNSPVESNAGPEVVASQRYVDILCDALPMLRNTLAHGSSSVWPEALSTFRLVAAAITWMYSSRDT